MHRYAVVLASMTAVVTWQTASATVLCARRSGTLVIRDVCRKTETLVDPAALGLQGPPGPPGPPGDPFGPCSADSVKVGNVCVDKYEASVWSIPAANTDLIAKVQHGTETLQDLMTGGATELNTTSFSIGCTPPFVPNTFLPNGNWADPVYAVSVPGVLPSACLTWFQAVQACAFSGKHLLTNEEWQRAAAGTPDPGGDASVGICTILSDPTPTGSHPQCVSSWGAYDMAGNVYEWVADWADHAAGCTNWPSAFGDDVVCWGGGAPGQVPGAVARGGYFGIGGGSYAGIFDVYALDSPSFAVEGIGFRCGR